MQPGKLFQNLPIITIDEGRLIGRVQDLYTDPEMETVTGLYLGSQGVLRRRAQLIPAENVVLFGVDAVLVDGSDIITDDHDYPKSATWRRRDEISGRDIETPGGTRLATVGDIVIENNGRLIGFLLSKVYVDGPPADQRLVARPSILDVGIQDGPMTAELAALEQGFQGIPPLVVSEQDTGVAIDDSVATANTQSEGEAT